MNAQSKAPQGFVMIDSEILEALIAKSNLFEVLQQYNQIVHGDVTYKIQEKTFNMGFVIVAIKQIAESLRCSEKQIDSDDLVSIANSLIYLLEHLDSMNLDKLNIYETNVENVTWFGFNGDNHKYIEAMLQTINNFKTVKEAA